MPTRCPGCDRETNDDLCPHCGVNIRALRAEGKAAMLESALVGWQSECSRLETLCKALESVIDDLEDEEEASAALERIRGGESTTRSLDEIDDILLAEMAIEAMADADGETRPWDEVKADLGLDNDKEE